MSTWELVKEIPSSNGKSVHRVERSGKELRCTCQGFRIQKKGYCKHTKLVGNSGSESAPKTKKSVFKKATSIVESVVGTLSTGFSYIKTSPPLVAKTRTKKNKYWQCSVVTDGKKWYTQTKYWQDTNDGTSSAIQVSEPYEATVKNVGRANETSAEEQAHLEFDSIVQKQRDKGYTEQGTVSDVLPLPMLAQKFKERGGKITYPVYVQPKYNGRRMLYNGTKGWSRGGKIIIPERIAHLAFDTKGHIVDGELMLPGNKLLQQSMTAIKKYQPGLSDTLQYIVYDIVEPDLPFGERYKILQSLVKNAPKNVVLAPTVLLDDETSVLQSHNSFTSLGFEGTMIRSDGFGYEIGHRSNQLLKLKDFVDGEFKIIDLVEGQGSYSGCGIFICENENGQQFQCNPEGSIEYKRQLFKDRKKLINQWLTIRYQELSRDLIPIFPVGVSVREKGEF